MASPIWERRGGGSGRNVTFPARQYSVNGERRSFALLRPIVDATAQNKLRELILEAFQEYEERAAIASVWRIANWVCVSIDRYAVTRSMTQSDPDA